MIRVLFSHTSRMTVYLCPRCLLQTRHRIAYHRIIVRRQKNTAPHEQKFFMHNGTVAYDAVPFVDLRWNSNYTVEYTRAKLSEITKRRSKLDYDLQAPVWARCVGTSGKAIMGKMHTYLRSRLGDTSPPLRPFPARRYPKGTTPKLNAF